LTLRLQITEAIKTANGNPENTSIAVCLLLEDEIGLAGNGWFDNDPEMQRLLE